MRLQYETPRPGFPEGVLVALVGAIVLSFGAALELWHIRSPDCPSLPGRALISIGLFLIFHFVSRGGR